MNSLRLLQRVASSVLILILAGCASQSPEGRYQINDSMQAKAQSSRIDMIVLHYTAGSTTTSLAVLTNKDVSSHYLVTDDKQPLVYRLVDDSMSAWHAGESSWYGKTFVNQRSIGIEIVHPGWERNVNGTMGAPYPISQVHTVTGDRGGARGRLDDISELTKGAGCKRHVLLQKAAVELRRRLGSHARKVNPHRIKCGRAGTGTSAPPCANP